MWVCPNNLAQDFGDAYSFTFIPVLLLSFLGWALKGDGIGGIWTDLNDLILWWEGAFLAFSCSLGVC